MKPHSFLMLFGLVWSTLLQAQFNCLSHDVYKEALLNDSMFRKNQELLEIETQQLLQNKSQSALAPAYVIPVVFHVIYTTTSGNISDAQIIDQINILNKEFKRQQADTALTPAAFLPFAAPIDMEFRLATLDPNGKCTNGINRIYSTLSNCSYNRNDVKALSYWPSDKYLNIWVVQTMHYGDYNCQGGGYAQFPGGSALTDGINIRGDVIGSIGTAVTSSFGNFKGRYLIHELGHYFNLRHIWGDAVCGNDLVADTPPHVNSNSGCPSFPHKPNSQCSGSNANGEMFTNYMDYTNGSCLNMFTAGQVARMTAALNSSVSNRNNLWSAQNLLTTGTADPYSYPVACAAVPDVLPAEPITACVGDSVKLTDKSYGGLLSSRSWSVPGGSANSLSDSIIKVKYTSPGLYPVSLTNTYLGNSVTKVYPNKVLVLNDVPNLSYFFPFAEGFEDSFMFTNNWVARNPDNDGTQWTLSNSTAFTGNNCVMLQNFNKSAPLVDELISPEYDLSTVHNPTLTFQVHFAARASTNNDKLQVYISNNCGKSWTSVYMKTANQGLKTTSVNISNSYTPAASGSEWRKENVNLLNSWAGTKVNLKFVFTSGGGNNIFLDDININGISTVGVEEWSIDQRLLVYPNPNQGLLAFTYRVREEGEVQAELTDLLGSVLLRETCSGQAFVTNSKQLDLQHLATGTYILTLRQNGAVLLSTKVIKNE